jgi:predicted RNase H-like HicB family nuclease
MKYIDVKSINETRRDFPTIINEAINSKEIICKNAKSKNKSQVSILSTNLLLEILSNYKFYPKLNFDKDTDLYELFLDEIGQYAYAETIETAKEELLDVVEIYLEDYMKNIEVYRKFEKKIKHYPYILKLAHIESRQGIANEVFKNLNIERNQSII